MNALKYGGQEPQFAYFYCLILFLFKKVIRNQLMIIKSWQKIQNHNKNDPGPQINQVGPGTLDSLSCFTTDNSNFLATFIPLY